MTGRSRRAWRLRWASPLGVLLLLTGVAIGMAGVWLILMLWVAFWSVL